METKYGFPKFFKLRKLSKPINCVGVSPTRVPLHLRAVWWCLAPREITRFCSYALTGLRTGFWIGNKENLAVSPSCKLYPHQ